MTAIAGHDAYIAAAPEHFRAILTNLRTVIARTLPDADEVIKYHMPGFLIGTSVVVGYAAFSKQCGIYLSPGAMVSHADAIASAGLKSTKTGITFKASNPIPDELVKRLALASRRDLGL